MTHPLPYTTATNTQHPSLGGSAGQNLPQPMTIAVMRCKRQDCSCTSPHGRDAVDASYDRGRGVMNCVQLWVVASYRVVLLALLPLASQTIPCHTPTVGSTYCNAS